MKAIGPIEAMLASARKTDLRCNAKPHAAYGRATISKKLAHELFQPEPDKEPNPIGLFGS